MIRDPFPNNIIPRDRIFNADGTYKNPLMDLYARMLPKPNQNFIENGQQPINNFYRGGEPDSPKSQQFGFRLDFNASSRDRFFFRTSGITFLEYVSDWTYAATDPALRIHSADRSRYQWSYTGNWTRAMGTTLLDSQFATNRFNQIDEFLGLKQYKPTDVGLPVYIDDFCSTRAAARCPVHRTVAGYQGFGGGLSDGDTATHMQAQSTITSVKGRHTLHGGVDVRRAQRDRTGGGNRSGSSTSIAPTRGSSATRATLTPSNLGLSLAAFVLGLPTLASINDSVASSFNNYWMGTFAQDTWRLGRFTLNTGLRFEYETGIQEKNGQMIVGFDPDGQARDHRRRPGGLPRQRAPEPAGYARDAQRARRADLRQRRRAVRRRLRGRALWMPRVSASYLLGDRTVLKGGYGLYYDTLTAVRLRGGAGGLQRHDDVHDLRRSGAHVQVGDARDRRRQLRSVPRARRRHALGSGGRRHARRQLAAGRDPATENGLRDHARQQRWRVSLQRELSSSLGVEVAYAGAFNDELPVTIRGDYLPEQYWDGSDVRNTAANTYLTAQVPNPYFINNFAALRTTDPVLYQRLASNPTFSSATIQRNRLLRPFGQMTNLTYSNLPLGASKSHSLEVQVNRRFSNGLTGFLSFNRQPGALQPHRRGVRPRADALAGEQRRAPLAPGREPPATSCRSAAAAGS